MGVGAGPPVSSLPSQLALWGPDRRRVGRGRRVIRWRGIPWRRVQPTSGASAARGHRRSEAPPPRPRPPAPSAARAAAARAPGRLRRRRQAAPVRRRARAGPMGGQAGRRRRRRRRSPDVRGWRAGGAVRWRGQACVHFCCLSPAVGLRAKTGGVEDALPRRPTAGMRAGLAARLALWLTPYGPPAHVQRRGQTQVLQPCERRQRLQAARVAVVPLVARLRPAGRSGSD
jgi:hypothetical protein